MYPSGECAAGAVRYKRVTCRLHKAHQTGTASTQLVHPRVWRDETFHIPAMKKHDLRSGPMQCLMAINPGKIQTAVARGEFLLVSVFTARLQSDPAVVDVAVLTRMLDALGMLCLRQVQQF